MPHNGMVSGHLERQRYVFRGSQGAAMVTSVAAHEDKSSRRGSGQLTDVAYRVLHGNPSTIFPGNDDGPVARRN